MLEFFVNENNLSEANLTFEELLVLILNYKNTDLEKVVHSLMSKGFVVPTSKGIVVNTKEGTEVLKLFNRGVDKSASNELCTTLKSLFPKGKKAGTNNQWTEGVTLIAKRLKLFFRKYGNDYTDDEIIKATEEYVKSFNGDYSYMRTLKYFIFKEEVKDGMTESSSELYTLLEKIRDGEDETTIRSNADWTSELK